MARSQFWINVQEQELRWQMLEELINYHRLRRAWGLGPLKIKRPQGTLDIWAEYFDIEVNRTRQAFLGGGKGKAPGNRPCNVSNT